MTEEQDRARILDRCLKALGREGIVAALRAFESNPEVKAALEWYAGNLVEGRGEVN